MWLPELDMHGADFLPELMIGRRDRNVAVKKHTRYNPLFVHAHSYFELIYVFEGECKNTIENHPIYMKTGDICIIAPGIRHSLGVFDDNTVVLNVLIRKSTFQENFFDVFQEDAALSKFFYKVYYSNVKDRFMCFHTAGNYELESLLDIMFSESIKEAPYMSRVMENLLRAAFCVMLRISPEEISLRQTSFSEQSVEEILRYIQINYAEITFHDLAEHFHSSESNLRRVLHNSVGQSFVNIVRQIRLQKACMLLENSNMQIGDIAIQVGYKSEEYFYRVFRKEYHMTPLEYRNRKEER